MIGDVLALFKMIMEWSEKLSRRDEEMNGKENFNAVVRALYELTDHGEHSVTLVELIDMGFRKMQVFEAIEQVDSRGWLIDCASHDERYAWILNGRGCQYVEALLEGEEE